MMALPISPPEDSQLLRAFRRHESFLRRFIHGFLAYHTQTGEQHRVLLADGSVVLLDTASEVRVDLNPSERHITLVHGKAHFEVTPDPSRPFLVDAGEGTVRAVGTAFSVYRQGSVVDVAVTEGKVEVRAQPPVLHPTGDLTGTAPCPATHASG